jgi:hypothetical protein
MKEDDLVKHLILFTLYAGIAYNVIRYVSNWIGL